MQVAVAFGKLHEILLENSILPPRDETRFVEEVSKARIPYNFHLETVSRRIDEASGTNARLELTTRSSQLLYLAILVF